jgi:hypothetical protein
MCWLGRWDELSDMYIYHTKYIINGKCAYHSNIHSNHNEHNFRYRIVTLRNSPSK